MVKTCIKKIVYRQNQEKHLILAAPEGTPTGWGHIAAAHTAPLLAHRQRPWWLTDILVWRGNCRASSKPKKKSQILQRHFCQVIEDLVDGYIFFTSTFQLTCLSLRMKSVSRNQKNVATTQVQVSAGISRNEASEAPAARNKTQAQTLNHMHNTIITEMLRINKWPYFLGQHKYMCIYAFVSIYLYKQRPKHFIGSYIF